MPQKGQMIRQHAFGNIRRGTPLTFNGEIITVGGQILHRKGEVRLIDYIYVISGYWSSLCPDMWIPEKIHAIKLIGVPGHWTHAAFFETQKLKA